MKEKYEFWGLNMPEKLESQVAFDIWAMCISIILIEKKYAEDEPWLDKIMSQI